jgi:hypothetical protein
MDAKRTELDADFESIENEKKKTFANRKKGRKLCYFFLTFQLNFFQRIQISTTFCVLLYQYPNWIVAKNGLRFAHIIAFKKFL